MMLRKTMSRLRYNLRMFVIVAATFTALGGPTDRIERSVEVSPDCVKNKAFRMVDGSAVCNLYLKPESPWLIRDSEIVGTDDRTLWKRLAKDRYFIAYGYAVNEYVRIRGDLYMQGAGKGSGNVELPNFFVTVPKVDLQWAESLGDASIEEKEDFVPVFLAVTKGGSCSAKLLIHEPKDDFSLVRRKVTLTWTNPEAVKVLDGEKVVNSGVEYEFQPNTKVKELDVCAIRQGDVKFALEGEPDVVTKERAVDYVHAKCVMLDFEIKSDKKFPYDEPTTEMLIDNRTATITVTTTPAGGDVSSMGLVFDVSTEKEGSLVNRNMKFDVEIEHKAGNQWHTKDVVYWYGMEPDHMGYDERLNYVFALKCNGEVVKTKKISVRWPEGFSYADWISPVVNDTTVGEVKRYESTKFPYWYCKIDFKEFFKLPGEIFTVGFVDGNGNRYFHDTSQYSEEIKKEEEYHVKQFLGEVDIAQCGMADCYTVKGLQYFVGELAKKKRYKRFVKQFHDEDGPCWGVKGSSLEDVKVRAESVIAAAIKLEIAESDRVRRYNGDDDKNGRGYLELMAKKEAGYNAAWSYDCTYRSKFGANPKRIIHKAYQETTPKIYETR